MRVCDLGPITVENEDGAHPCSGSKQAAILTLLAMRVNERVSVHDLAAAGWGYAERVSASSVENHVWRLRRLLEPRRPRGAVSVLTNVAGGYRLALPPSAVDSMVFEATAERSAAALRGHDFAGTLVLCRQALALWRGQPYEAAAHLPAVVSATGRLEELRGQVAERQVEALLALGETHRALAELEALVALYPYRERLWARRISALVSEGRTDDGVRAYHDVRRILRDELGLEPGPELRRALADALARPERLVPVAGDPRRRPGRQTSSLVGRRAELSDLAALVASAPLVSVVGPGGCGKTRLALELTRTVTPSFPDGVHVVDLTTLTQPEQVLDEVVSTLGIASTGQNALGAVVDHVRARRLLLVLDNCEHVVSGAATLAAALLAVDSSATVLVTSRQPLDLEHEQVWPLAPLRIADLPPAASPDDPAAPGDLPAPSEAAALFLARSGRPVRGAQEQVVVEDICRAVDGLPLAIELAAARTGTFSLAEILDQVTQDPSRLGRLGHASTDHQDTVWAAVDWSYRLLDRTEQAIHRRLAVVPGPFTLSVAAAVAQGHGLDVHDVAHGLARLAHRSVLGVVPAASGPTVFRQLETVRAHAYHRLREAGEADQAAAQRDRWVRALLEARPRLGEPAEAAWFDAVEASWPSVRATLLGLDTRTPGEADLQLLASAAGLAYFCYYRARVVETRGWLQAALEDLERSPVGPGHPSVVLAEVAYATLCLLSGRADLAAGAVPRALASIDDLPDDRLLDLGEALTGAADAAWAQNEFPLLATLDEALGRVSARAGDPGLDLLARKVRVEAHLLTWAPGTVAESAEELFVEGRAAGNLLVQWSACGLRAITGVLTEDPAAVTTWTDRLIGVHLRLGPGGGGAFLEQLANAATLSGRYAEAIPLYAASVAEARRVGMSWPVQLGSDDLLERSRAALAVTTVDRLWSQGQALTLLDVARERQLID